MDTSLTPMKALKWSAGLLVGFLVLIQLVPYGRAHVNPQVVQEPAWDSPSTRALAAKACFDCHSNETRWPWYSHLAPMSWFVQKHVDEARRELNFSEWQKPQPEAKEAADEILDDKMPMPGYLLFHAESKLTPTEKQALADGIRATLEKSPPLVVGQDTP